jgi:pyruvate/2-oxoglutarate dehydrogenase complex dihydrolipoamide dehydrogenase (E3) component
MPHRGATSHIHADRGIAMDRAASVSIDPQVAHRGLSETEARRQGRAVRMAKVPTAAVLRTHTIDETHGFLGDFRKRICLFRRLTLG